VYIIKVGNNIIEFFLLIWALQFGCCWTVRKMKCLIWTRLTICCCNQFAVCIINKPDTLLIQFSKHLLCYKLPSRPPVVLCFMQVKEGNKLSCLKQKSSRFRTLHQRRTMPLTGQDFVLQDYTMYSVDNM
jgi:hypothetical protein